MHNSLILIGYGPGLGQAIAARFGAAGYRIGLISRARREALLTALTNSGVTTYFEPADARDLPALRRAISRLVARLGGVNVLVYNAAVLKPTDILQLAPAELTQDFEVNVAAALGSVQAVLHDLGKTGGAVLFTGGGLATHPSPQYGSLSVGKAGLRNLALQLHQRLQPAGVYVGLVTITQGIQAGDPTYSPAALAEHFWQLAQHRTKPEAIL